MSVAVATYERTPADYLAAFSRRRGAFALASAGVMLIAVLIALLWPPTFRANATILIEQQEIPPELVRATVTSFADQRIQSINQRVMTGENLLGIIDRFDLYPTKRKRYAREELLEKVRDNISLEVVSAEVMDPRRGVPTNATIAFKVGFDDEDPAKAYRVANELTSLYLNENLATRTAHAKDATTFLHDEAERLARQVTALETELAEFKEKNVNALPELFEMNTELRERTERDLEEVDRTMRANDDRRRFLESELTLQNPYQSLVSETGERLLSPADRLKSLQSQLASMLGVYSEAHPDVKRIRDSIAGLQAEVDDVERRRELAIRLDAKKAELAAIRERYSDDYPAVKVLGAQVDALIAMMGDSVNDSRVSAAPTNPAYVQLETQLDTLNAERVSLDQRYRDLEAKRNLVESRLQRTPQIEKRYRDLSLNLQNASQKLLEVRSKAMEAQLGESLEADRKGERFTLIDPAQVPEKPLSPNRMLILSLGLVLALAGGFAAVAAYEALDQRVFGARMVTALLGVAPLASVPVLATEDEERSAVRGRWLWAGAFVVTLLGAAALFHVFVMPLDTAAFALLRRYGL